MRDNTLIKYLKLAERIDASDIHIKSGKCAIARVSGTLKQIDDAILTKEQVFSFIQDILTEKQMTEFDLYSDVDSSFSVGDRRFRCNVYRDFNGFSISIRRIINEIGDFRSLGIPEVLKNLAVKKSGLILVTGPTGSGKTTTLASIVNYLNRVITAHIITIEDPIEYTYTSNRCVITQREIGRDASDYPRALRASLRQDPDVIMLGEMRDLESIRTALTAAETGHLVLSTLHTTGACNSIDRIIDVFPADQQQQIRVQLSMVLLGVVSQQLVPNVKGGRSLATEVMICNGAIKNIIREGKNYQLQNTMMTSRNAGMYIMEQCLEAMYRQGIISAENYQLYTPASAATNVR